MTLRAVLFDIDDTFCATTQFASIARGNAIDAMIATGLAVPRDEVLRELEEVIAEFSSNYGGHFDRLLQRLHPASLEDASAALIVAAGVAAYHDTKFRALAPFEDLIPLLKDLERAGIRRGVITHGLTVKQAEKIVRMGLAPHLDPTAIFISDEVGISKPNPKLYQHALDRMGLAPDEVMYVGDNPEHDVAPPQSLGIHAVWCRRTGRNAEKGRAAELGITPDHVITDFEELRQLLRDEFGVPV